MKKRGIHFDEIIKNRVSKKFVINLFIDKQNKKIFSPLRTALHNKTIENINFIYTRDKNHFL